MFAPSQGIVEDPATGSASGPVGCYLVTHNLVPRNRADRIVSLQGVAMGRPSYIHIKIGTNDRGEEIRKRGQRILARGAPRLEISIQGPMTEARLRGTRVVAITVEYSATANKADDVLVIRPGTDPALALGFAVGILPGLGGPTTLALVRGVYWSLSLAVPGVRTAMAAWLPVVVGAGVGQISSIIDTQLASLLGGGAVAWLGYSQLLSLLPLSLFGVSIAAAALPELSRDAAGEAVDLLRQRLGDGIRRLGFLVVPSAFGLAALGEPLVAAVFQTGRFGPEDTAVVTGILAAYALGIPGQASIKLLASGFYAQGDTRTPVKIAALSLAVAAGSAFGLMHGLGPAGIALGSSVGAYLNMALNYRGLVRRVGRPLGTPEIRSLWIAIAGSVVATAAGVVIHGIGWGPWPTSIAALSAFLVAYQGVGMALRHPDALGLWRVLGRR